MSFEETRVPKPSISPREVFLGAWRHYQKTMKSLIKLYICALEGVTCQVVTTSQQLV